jgi:glycogen synthase
MSRRFYRVESTQDLLAFMDKGESANMENRWCFETAWEAANKGAIVIIFCDNFISVVKLGSCIILFKKIMAVL